MHTLSGPVEFLFADFDIASWTWTLVMCMGVGVKCFVCLSIFRFLGFVECLMVFTNCLLNADAFC